MAIILKHFILLAFLFQMAKKILFRLPCLHFPIHEAGSLITTGEIMQISFTASLTFPTDC